MGDEAVDAAGRLLGLPGFAVLAVADYGGEVEVLVETTASSTGCPRCGVLAELHDRRARLVRDLPIGGRPVALIWLKRVWRCPDPDCGQRTWSETTPAIRPRSVLTERARVEACRRVGQQDQLLAYFTTDRTSNGPTEAVNLLIKRIKRVGFGFRNFANYRLRLLLHCGITWHTPRTARIRGRSPRLVS